MIVNMWEIDRWLDEQEIDESERDMEAEMDAQLDRYEARELEKRIND